MSKKPSYEELRKVWGQITARAWEDRKFKERLLTHPKEIFKEYGIHTSAEMQYRVHEDDKAIIHWVLREKPEGLSSADLKKLAAATDCQCVI